MQKKVKRCMEVGIGVWNTELFCGICYLWERLMQMVQEKEWEKNTSRIGSPLVVVSFFLAIFNFAKRCCFKNGSLKH